MLLSLQTPSTMKQHPLTAFCRHCSFMFRSLCDGVKLQVIPAALFGSVVQNCKRFPQLYYFYIYLDLCVWCKVVDDSGSCILIYSGLCLVQNCEWFPQLYFIHIFDCVCPCKVVSHPTAPKHGQHAAVRWKSRVSRVCLLHSGGYAGEGTLMNSLRAEQRYTSLCIIIPPPPPLFY